MRYLEGAFQYILVFMGLNPVFEYVVRSINFSPLRSFKPVIRLPRIGCLFSVITNGHGSNDGILVDCTKSEVQGTEICRLDPSRASDAKKISSLAPRP